MRCQSLGDAIVELARTGTAGKGTRAAIDSHLETCESCAALLERERQLSTGLRALAATTVGDMPSDLVERRLLAAFDAGQKTRPSRPVWRGRWAQIAAAVVLATSAVLWASVARRDSRDSSSVARSSGAVVTEPARPPQEVPPVAAASTEITGPETKKVEVVRAPRANGGPPSVVRATGFVAIPGAAGLPAFESGEIVRVEVALSSLPTYGIEILPDVRTEVVEADFLVGQDGQARAIRLVSSNDLR